jgi:hypothetical protein
MDTIVATLTWGGKGVGSGKSADQKCALARPYARFIAKGKPIGKINYVFLNTGKPMKIVGSLCHTAGERILFFPALTGRNVHWVHYSSEGRQAVETAGLIDHITLESNLEDCHVTILDNKGKKTIKLRSFKTKNVGENCLFWFGMSVKNLDYLETTPEELTISFNSPAKDSNKKTDEFLKAREGTIFHLLELDENRSINLNKEEFIHFDFFLGPDNLKGFPCCTPTAEPLVSAYVLPKEGNVNSRAHPANLGGINSKIWIVVSKHTGNLSDNTLLTVS